MSDPEWMSRCKRTKDLMSAGAHAAALLYFLDPARSEFKSLADIADSAGMSRASLSKALLNLRDESGLRSWSMPANRILAVKYIRRVQISVYARAGQGCAGAQSDA